LLTLINDIYKSPIPGYRLSGYSILGQTPRNVEIAVSFILIKKITEMHKIIKRQYDYSSKVMFPVIKGQFTSFFPVWEVNR